MSAVRTAQPQLACRHTSLVLGPQAGRTYAGPGIA
jgi:hypothetical protein